MAASYRSGMPWWAWGWPLAAWAILAVAIAVGLVSVLPVVAGAVMIATVFAAVYHAEVIAHRVGEPFGTLVLAVAVTVIEVALIVSIMVAGGPEKAGLPRDTVFAAVMIICNGLVGICLLSGGVRHHEQGFQLQGALAALAVLAALMTLTLVLPNVATSRPAPPSPTPSSPSPRRRRWCSMSASSSSRRCAIAIISCRREAGRRTTTRPPHRTGWRGSASSCSSCRFAVIGLAKALTPSLEAGLDLLGAPKAIIGIVIALLVLMPEGLAALRAARLNRLQTSMNLALGSALASIGLTIPAVAVVSFFIGQPLALGLDNKDTVLLVITLIISIITLGTGRTTVLQGIVHLVIFAAFLFFAFVP